MTARDWKPGDVAMVTCCGDLPMPMLRDDTNTGWHAAGGTFYWDKATGDWEIEEVRPLVVIDAEDREQVERFRDLLDKAWKDQDRQGPCEDALQTALRQFANPTPPKPEEPTGLGAVVEDVEGHRWVRAGLGIAGADAVPWQGVHPGPRERRHWREIAAVRVLSEGVQA